jgi:AAA domain
VFVRSRVLIISLEDDETELRRRIRAVCLHYGISQDELRGWLFLSAPGANAGKLKIADKRGVIADGALGPKLEAEIVKRQIDIIVLDPLVKAHAVNENDNAQVDSVVGLLTDLSIQHDIAIDVPHHISKGTPDPGNANRSRGASSMVNGGRLIFTITAMSAEEAATFGINENERREYVRVDKAKVNITKSSGPAKWFRLISVDIGNGTDLYPHGDSVQVAEPWNPPETWADVSTDNCNQILTVIDAGLPGGNFYTDAPRVQDRAAWRVVLTHVPDKPEGQCREIIRTWVSTGVLERFEYENPATRKPVKGLRVNSAKRPG